MTTILHIARAFVFDAASYTAGVYEIITEGDPVDNQVTRKTADKLLKSYGNIVHEFKDNEPIVNLIEWRRKNLITISIDSKPIARVFAENIGKSPDSK